MRYLGIDESNHGKFPEIFVGAFSNRDKDITKGDIGKIRKKGRQNNVIGSRQFRYIIMSREYGELFGSYGAMAFVSYAELIRTFPNIKRVIIDGKISESEKIIRGLEFVLDEMPEIDFIPKADIIIPIVNTADCIANSLYRYHTSNPREEKSHHLRNLITPDIKQYMPIISKIF